jgi:hypothetical protein
MRALVRRIARAPFEAERHAIDVSGDGTHNARRDVQFFRNRAVAEGIVVNGIVILTDIQFSQYPLHTNPPGGIEKYYRDNVIGSATCTAGRSKRSSVSLVMAAVALGRYARQLAGQKGGPS